MLPWVVISGGQTGADRGGLDAAIALGIPIGGWLTKGRRAEDGFVPARYAALIETEDEDYAHRTILNVKTALTTIVIRGDRPGPGTRLTLEQGRLLGRRLIDVNLDQIDALEKLRVAWNITPEYQRTVVNVAGQRESSRPGIQRATQYVLTELWRNE